MILTISIMGSDGQIKAEARGEGFAALAYAAPYAPGDCLCLRSDEPGLIVTQMEDSIAPVYGLLRFAYLFPIPFGEKRISYSPKSFEGNLHLLWAREAEEAETRNYRNLALNPLDHHGNAGLFPHVTANVETRGEAVFAARNAIDGNHLSSGHGPWPYESWGINRQDDAEIHLDFGREVTLAKLMITLRADFPHDNWWQSGTITFSDGSAFHPAFVKSGMPQSFSIGPRRVTWLKLSHLIKDPLDASPFPALVQLEAWGAESRD